MPACRAADLVCRRPTAEFRTDDAGAWQRVTGVLLSGNVIASQVIQRAKDSGAFGDQLGALSLEDITDVQHPVRRPADGAGVWRRRRRMCCTLPSRDRLCDYALQGFNSSALPTSVYESSMSVSWPDTLRAVTGKGAAFTGACVQRTTAPGCGRRGNSCSLSHAPEPDE